MIFFDIVFEQSDNYQITINDNNSIHHVINGINYLDNYKEYYIDCTIHNKGNVDNKVIRKFIKSLINTFPYINVRYDNKVYNRQDRVSICIYNMLVCSIVPVLICVFLTCM